MSSGQGSVAKFCQPCLLFFKISSSLVLVVSFCHCLYAMPLLGSDTTNILMLQPLAMRHSLPPVLGASLEDVHQKSPHLFHLGCAKAADTSFQL